MSKWWGKKKAFIVAQTISIVGYIMLYFLFVPGKPWMYIFGLPFFSFGIGSLFTIMMSMTADILDIDELNTGLRREGIFGPGKDYSGPGRTVICSSDAVN